MHMDARLRLLEVLYRFDLDELSHTRLIQETASRHWQRHGPIMLLSGHLNQGGLELAPIQATRDGGCDYQTFFSNALPGIPADEVHGSISADPTYGSAVEAGSQGVLNNKATMLLGGVIGVADMLGFYTGTGEGGLVGLMTTLSAISATSQRERNHWQPIAAHLAAAWRLRQRFDSGVVAEDLADAVLRPDGRCTGGTRARVHGAMRDRLRELVRRRELERSVRTASDGMWSELADGRWTLIDHFDSNGQRVVLALRNAPRGESLCRLTRQEVEALGRARTGASNKEIALSMNISMSSVTRLLQSVAWKLNAAVADIIQFLPADTIRCRSLLFGNSSLTVFSRDAVSEWQSVLSDTEKSVVAAVLRGCSNRKIAAMRGRSVRTVINQLASAFEKLGVRSRRELVSRVAGVTSPTSIGSA